MDKVKDLQNSLYFCTLVDSTLLVQKSYIVGKLLLVFCHQGEAKMYVGTTLVNLDSDHMLLLHPHAELTLISVSDDFKATNIGFMMGLQDSVLQDLNPAFFAHILKTPCWTLDAEQKVAANGFCRVFDYVCNKIDCQQKSEMVSNLFTVFIQAFYANTSHLYTPMEETRSISGRNIMLQFVKLLQKHFRDDHRVSYYADMLCISAKYLTQTVKRASGRTPKEYIDNKLAVESLYLLKQTSKTIQEISIELGFPDQSYFGRFFKRIFGISPMAYRLNPSLDLMKKLSMNYSSPKHEDY